MGEVEEAQEQMKANMEAMKEQMATVMEAIMSMRKIMEANAVAVSATSAVAKVNPMPPPPSLIPFSKLSITTPHTDLPLSFSHK